MVPKFILKFLQHRLKSEVFFLFVSFLTCPFERTGYEGRSTPLKAVSFSVCMCFTSETFKTSFIRVWFDETPLSLTLLMDDLHYCRAPDPCDSTSAAANSNTAVFLCVLLTLKSTEAVKLRVLYEMRTRELIYFAVTTKSSFKVKHPNDWRPSGVSPCSPHVFMSSRHPLCARLTEKWNING